MSTHDLVVRIVVYLVFWFGVALMIAGRVHRKSEADFQLCFGIGFTMSSVLLGVVLFVTYVL
jgi:hypothetical protein